MSGDVPIRTILSREQVKVLYALSVKHGTTIEALVRECVRRQMPTITPAEVVEPEPVSRVRQAHLTSKGVLRRPVTKADVAEMRALLKEGYTQAEIGRRMGRSQSTISKMRSGLIDPNRIR